MVGLLGAYACYRGELPLRADGFIVLALFIGLPILNLLDTYVWERKYYKLGKSATEKHNTIILQGKIDDVFNICLQVIDAEVNRHPLNSRILMLQRPNLIRYLIGSYLITITADQMGDEKVKVILQSDSQLVTARIDFGINQRNINRIDRLIRAGMVHSVQDGKNQIIPAIEINPLKDNDDFYLEIKNNGQVAEFEAQIKIKEDITGYKKNELYIGYWLFADSPKSEIKTGHVDRLKIAHLNIQSHIIVMSLELFYYNPQYRNMMSFSSTAWSPTPNDAIIKPVYMLKISISAKPSLQECVFVRDYKLDFSGLTEIATQ